MRQTCEYEDGKLTAQVSSPDQVSFGGFEASGHRGRPSQPCPLRLQLAAGTDGGALCGRILGGVPQTVGQRSGAPPSSFKSEAGPRSCRQREQEVALRAHVSVALPRYHTVCRLLSASREPAA